MFKVVLLYLWPTEPQSIYTFSLQGQRSGGAIPKSLLATVKNRLLQTSSSWNIKLQPTVRVCSHAPANMIFVLLDIACIDLRVTMIGVLIMKYDLYW